ncbi:Protein transport protein Sec24D [Sarcoptes scabiei]|uniref:Protein transport protein Sec24C n=1 Tax=Sarcoptes scabiei TaxID=52283 RepID=A0A834R6R8_SARSC|nr:Protein transport protein Sec24D [Sarcoptes scabiei]
MESQTASSNQMIPSNDWTQNVNNWNQQPMNYNSMNNIPESSVTQKPPSFNNAMIGGDSSKFSPNFVASQPLQYQYPSSSSQQQFQSFNSMNMPVSTQTSLKQVDDKLNNQMSSLSLNNDSMNNQNQLFNQQPKLYPTDNNFQSKTFSDASYPSYNLSNTTVGRTDSINHQSVSSKSNQQFQQSLVTDSGQQMQSNSQQPSNLKSSIPHQQNIPTQNIAPPIPVPQHNNFGYDGQPIAKQLQSQPLSTNSWNSGASSQIPSTNNYDQQNGSYYHNFPTPNAYQNPGQIPSSGPIGSMNTQYNYQQQSMFNNNRYPPPPMLSNNQMSSTGGMSSGLGSGQFSPMAQQQQNKLDPEAMPSVVQVLNEDKSKFESNNNVLFCTSIPAAIPPQVTTILDNENQIIQDGGSASPIFLRPTIYQVPVNEDNLKISDIPFGTVIKPFDDQEVERKIYVPISPSEIIRCNRCKAYMNPYNRFIDGGRRFQCSLCHHLTEVSPSYFSDLDHIGQRLDKHQRPELCLGSYEFIATEEYCRNSVSNNRRPHLIFACELTETSKPILNILTKNLIEIIKNFPRDPSNPEAPPPMFGFLTYNSKIQIYDILNNGHAHVVCDLSMPFSPMNTFLIDPLIHMDKIENFLLNLPHLYANEELDMQTILGPVIEAALMSTQVDVNNWINQCLINKIVNDQQQNITYETIPAGKIYLFHCTLPTFGDAETPGRLKQRWAHSPDEIRKLLGTDKEKTVLAPDLNKYYIQLGQKCVTDYASGVELFLFPSKSNGTFLDIATLGELVRLTGTGSIFKFYNDFSEAFLTDLKYSLFSSYAFDCVLKVRTSTGIRPHDYIGNFYSRSLNDIECAAINTNTNFCIEFKYDDKLQEDEHVVIQAGILYTSLSGQRRVRIHNIALASCQQIGDVYRNSCCDTIVNLMARNAVYNLRNGNKTIQQTKESIVNRVINIFTAYRKHCAQPGSSLGQLILPETLKILPMYICGLLKCDAIDGGPEMTPDDKAFAQLKLIGSSVSMSQLFLYPKLTKIEYENENEDSELKYLHIRCSGYKLNTPAMAYVLENGFYIILMLTTSGCTNLKFLKGLFGPNVDSVTKIQIDQPLPHLLTPESLSINKFFRKIENDRKCSYKVHIIRQGIDKSESVFRSFLYEDQKMITRSVGESKLEGLSYVDLLCHLHKEIRAQIN